MVRATRARRGRGAGRAHGAGHERWMVSYADMVTLLFALFTCLYAMSRVDTTKATQLGDSVRRALGNNELELRPSRLRTPKPAAPREAAPPAPEVDPLELLEQQLTTLSNLPQLKGHLSLRREERGLVVGLDEASLFPSGSAELRREGIEALMEVGRTIAKGPKARVTVEGHTDDVPIKNGRYASNWELSTARAHRVLSLLVLDTAVDPKRMAVAGYGAERPLVPNTSAESRSRNRRVDLVIAPPVPLGAAAASAPGNATGGTGPAAGGEATGGMGPSPP